jgi:hypothetical protein
MWSARTETSWICSTDCKWNNRFSFVMWCHSPLHSFEVFLIFISMLNFNNWFSYLGTICNFLYNLSVHISLSEMKDWACVQIGWRAQFNVRKDHNDPVLFVRRGGWWKKRRNEGRGDDDDGDDDRVRGYMGVLASYLPDNYDFIL